MYNKKNNVYNIIGGRMKKILWAVLIMFCLTGCDNLMNTPTKKVEYLLGKYQSNDQDVLKQLDNTLSTDNVLKEEQKNRYKKIMERQYKDLMYTIKNEAIDGKTAVVEVEIEVYDYASAVTMTEDDLINNSEKYKDSAGEIDNTLYNNTKLDNLENVNNRIKYTINFTLSKIDEEWIVDDLTETERMKIHGLYAY